MADILLLEPNYKNKYPPLGLMKISTFHKEHKKDFVRFAKGQLPELFKNKKWDRVYVTTLFTFEWNEIIKTVEYAKSITKSINQVFVGGIAATLMSEELEKETGIKPISGLLNNQGQIGYDDDNIIDCLTPDYSILDDIRNQYVYPFENAYFTYTTRGCGMNCGFCAVKKLEPNYIDRISITNQILEIDKRFGQKKDLLLMDNNVLKSAKFFEIVDEIKELGFAKGATYINPLTKKKVKRYVDFNQGLDAFLLNEEKAKKLSELAIRPARIAFDHVEDEGKYKRAISLCAKYGITELSNYILYNSENFSGKGHEYNADTPEDLYRRLQITIDLKEEINDTLPNEQKISIFSFPMRYIPLNAKKRGYVGTEWCEKYLRAVQTMLIPTQGKGVSGRGFFEADFGKNLDEFLETLLMPESIIASRGIVQDDKIAKQKKEVTDAQLRRKQEQENYLIITEWKRLFYELGNVGKEEFITVIKHNIFTFEQFNILSSCTSKKLFLHYLSERKFLLMLSRIDKEEDIKLIFDYVYKEFNVLFRKIIQHIYSSQLPHLFISYFLKVFQQVGLKALLERWVEDKYKNLFFINSLEKISDSFQEFDLNITIIRIFKYYVDFNALTNSQIVKAEKYILDLNTKNLKDILLKNSEPFKKAAMNAIGDDYGRDELKKEIDLMVNYVRQLTLFERY